MFEWKKEYRWDFSDEGRSAPDKGPAITGSKMFRGGQYKNVIRETAQNSSDAKDVSLTDDVPVKMEFRYIEVDRKDILLDESIKNVGNYEVKVKLHKDIIATVKVEVKEL